MVMGRTTEERPKGPDEGWPGSCCKKRGGSWTRSSSMGRCSRWCVVLVKDGDCCCCGSTVAACTHASLQLPSSRLHELHNNAKIAAAAIRVMTDTRNMKASSVE